MWLNMGPYLLDWIKQVSVLVRLNCMHNMAMNILGVDQGDHHLRGYSYRFHCFMCFDWTVIDQLIMRVNIC